MVIPANSRIAVPDNHCRPAHTRVRVWNALFLEGVETKAMKKYNTILEMSRPVQAGAWNTLQQRLPNKGW